MKLTKKTAKALCIKKWEYIVANDGDYNGLENSLPELSFCNFLCGYCELTNTKLFNTNCRKCPLYILTGKECFDPDSTYATWRKNQTKANAQKVLDLIKKS
jgi:hypothetical protein